MKKFRIGGVHPEENKLSAGKKIEVMDLPKQAVFPLSQHIGAPAVPCVAKGDLVKVGTKIADAGGFVSAAIFSSVSGKVAKIDTAIDASGYRKPAIYIDVDGDEWEPTIDRSDAIVYDTPLEPKEIVAKIQNAGLVGMGGACFPVHVKLSPRTPVDVVIINAVECEPYLTADHSLMLEKPEQILIGVNLIMKAVGVKKAYIAIENNKPDAIALMEEKVKGFAGIEVCPLKVRYPQGGEKQLIDAVVGRQVPNPPALPADVGAIVQNVGTAYAIYEAVMKNKPLFERVVTVTGKSVAEPKNLLTRMGTPMSLLIEKAGGMPEDTGKVIGGGPMMGKALLTTDVPVCKGSSGILLMTEKESVRREPNPCIRCAKCVSACPMGLEPYLLQKLSEYGNWEQAEAEDIMTCIECGCCQFTCPSHRPLLDWIRTGKGTVGGIIRARSAKK